MQNKSLIQITSEAMALTSKLLESNGELTPELEQALTVNATDLATKVDSYVAIDEQMEAQELIFKAKVAMFYSIQKGFANSRERLKSNIKAAMITLGETDLSGNDYRYKLSNTKPSLVISSAEVPPEFKIVVTETVDDKEKIRIALGDGFEVAGCSLVASQALRVYANKGKGK